MKCGHHRQRVAGEVLPCAHPACPDAIPAEELLVNAPGGPLRFVRHRSNERISGGVVRGHYMWREAVFDSEKKP